MGAQFHWRSPELHGFCNEANIILVPKSKVSPKFRGDPIAIGLEGYKGQAI